MDGPSVRVSQTETDDQRDRTGQWGGRYKHENQDSLDMSGKKSNIGWGDHLGVRVFEVKRGRQ